MLRIRIVKVLSLVMVFVIAFGFFNANATYGFVIEKQEPTEVEYTIEAEEFTGGGFSVIDDAEASGGKVLVGSGNSDTKMSYTLKLDSDVNNLVLYGVHKASEEQQALSYIAFEGFERYSLYDYEYNVWNTTRLYYGNAKKGEYKINLTSVRAGQRIDKIIVKYDRVQTAVETETSENATQNVAVEEDTSKYRKGNPDLEYARIAEMVEETNGFFVAECENATYNKQTGAVIETEGASGGKVYITTSTQHNRDSSVGMVEMQYKFYISKNANYRLWIRYYTPSTDAKDAWISFDGQQWKECGDGTITGEYKWLSSVNADLGVGWHTIDVKHRTAGWYMDKFLITNDASFTPEGFGSLPGESSTGSIVIDKTAQLIAEKRLNPKVKSNNFRFRSDAGFEFVDGDIMLPSTNLAAALGIFHQDFDDYILLTRDRTYMKIYKNSTRVIGSGRVIDMPKASYSVEGEKDIFMVSLKAAQETFGLDYEYDATENTLHIFDFYEEPYVRTATEEELQIEPYVNKQDKMIYYTIPYDNPDAKVEVWFRHYINDYEALMQMNWDSLELLEYGGKKYEFSNNYNYAYAPAWYKGQTPVYKDGAFRGAQHVLDSWKSIKVVITDNGKQDEFMLDNLAYGGWPATLTTEEYVYKTGGELYLVPTFENISYYIDTEYDDAECKITYRKVGENTWNDVTEPMFDSIVNQFRGSIPFLNQDTEYEVKAVISNKGRILKESTATIRTWQDNPPIAETIKLKDIYSGSGDLTLLDYKGTADGWIKIDGEGMTVDANKQFFEAVTITGCEYLILENVKVRGGTDYGVVVDAKCHDIRLINCDIAEWGLADVQDYDFGSYYRGGECKNNQAGLVAINSRNFVLERSYIHDPDCHANAWSGPGFSRTHPMGGTAVLLWGVQGLVLRYNDFVGSDEYRYNDVLEGVDNGNLGDGSTGRDADVYGNLLIFSQDDAIELDGSQMNVRFYQNRVEQTYNGISTTPINTGPNYIYRNLVYNLGASNGEAGVSVKLGNAGYTAPTDENPDYWPRQHFFNNTFCGQGGFQSYGNADGEWHGTTRNNIYATFSRQIGWGYGQAFYNNYADGRDDYDYDIIYGRQGVPKGQEKNGIYTAPQFVNADAAVLNLVDDSPGWKAGEKVPGFTATDTPNIGAFVGDEHDELFLPARPVDLSADVYQLNLKSGETATVKINVGDIKDVKTYNIVKNRDFEFLTILNEETENVELKPNSVVELKVKAETVGKGVVMFRLANGYSLPITVYCEK